MMTLRRFGLTSTLCLLALSSVSCAGEAESAEDADGVPTESPYVVDASESPAAEAAMAAEAPAPSETPAAPTPAARRQKAPVPAATEPVATEPAADPDEDMPAPEPSFIASGTTLTFAVEAAMSTSVNKVGDAFSATLVADVLAEDGRVLLPQGALLLGRVTESLESPSSDQPAVIRLAIESIDAGGMAYPVLGDVESVQMETSARESDRRTAATVTVGAAAGALVGRLAGKTKTGAVAGAAAGAAVAIASKDGQATIPAGALLVIRLSERLVLP